MTNRIDFKKTLDSYRAKRNEFRLLILPERRYLMIDGSGDPNNSPAYADSLAALYPVAYKLKFASKRQLGRDYVVPPLEGLWWAEEMTAFTTARDKSKWFWTMMLMVPEWIEDSMFEASLREVAGKTPPLRLEDVRLEAIDEGLCVQTLHVGPFDAEGDLLERMHEQFIPSHGLHMVGKHHEIYLTDPRRTAQENLRTILRQPVREFPS